MIQLLQTIGERGAGERRDMNSVHGDIGGAKPMSGKHLDRTANLLAYLRWAVKTGSDTWVKLGRTQTGVIDPDAVDSEFEVDARQVKQFSPLLHMEETTMELIMCVTVGQVHTLQSVAQG